MPKSTRTLTLALVVASVILSSCATKDDGGGSGGTAVPIPTLGTILWRSNGGSSTAGQGGQAGDFDFDSAGGDIMLDDGRTRPTIATNFLTTGVMADNLVTYAELESIQMPTGTTTKDFTLPAGTGLDLPAGVTMNLSDAGAGINGVEFISDSEVSITGPVVLTRTGLDAVTFSIETSSTSPAALVSTGHVDGRGDVAVRGAGLHYYVSGTGGGMLVLLTADLSAGDTVGAGTGSNGGSASFYSEGDLIIQYGAVQNNGGNGGTLGGPAGELTFTTITGTMASTMNWSQQAHGGTGGSGNGGQGGAFRVYAPLGDVDMYAYVEGNGGDSATGNGGNAGVITINLLGTGATLSGAFVYNKSKGNVTGAGGAAGLFGSCRIDADVLMNFTLTATANGGTSAGTSGTSNGSAGGDLRVFADTISNATLDYTANGGNATEAGGTGGLVEIWEHNTAGTFTVTDLTVNVELNGGAGGQTGLTFGGGNGGNVTLGRPSAGSASVTAAVNSATFNINANGGVTSSTSDTVGGGDGGDINVGHFQGVMTTTINANINGGSSMTGGNAGYGGDTSFIMEDGTLNVTANINANGGNGERGRNGGNFSVEPNDGGAGGGASVDANISLRGGKSTGTALTGGEGGDVFVACGLGGSFTSSNFTSDQRGGDSETGQAGDGGEFTSGAFDGPATFSAGSINLDSGVSATSSGSAIGGEAGSVNLNTNDHLMTFNVNISMVGGAGVNADGSNGNGLNVQINADSDAAGGSLILGGNINMSGGGATGSGNGSNGAWLYINSNTASTGSGVTINSTITFDGGASAGANGGQSGGCSIAVYGDIVINGNLLARGGTGTSGGNGNGFFEIYTPGNLTVAGTIDTSGGNGTNQGGDGGEIELGVPGNQPALITVISTAVIRSNGGTGTTVGSAGIIIFDPTGTGGANLVEQGGSIVESNDGGGTPVANITRN
ncbi:hypothetical protein OAU50_07730 [Planctomycetota bacterium]|nr:hypothetical protein [Planctomycetota bacterium]